MEQNKQYKTPEKSSEKTEIKIKIYDIDSSSIEILKEISKNLFKYIIDILPSNTSKEKKDKIETYFNKIQMLLKKLNSDRNKMISKYDSILKFSEEKIRSLYSTLFNMKIKNTFLENNIDILLKKEKEYRLVKEKTGILVENGVIIHNDRKEHEIFILRVENSNLKNVINKKDEELKDLKEKHIKEKKEFIKKIEDLKFKNEQLKIKIKQKNKKLKGHSCSSININNIDINDANISNNNGNNINNNINIKNIINPVKRRFNSNLLNNNNKYISLIHCQSMGNLNLDAILNNKKSKTKSKSKNKTNNNINNISKNNINNNQNLILNNINISPIRHKKKIYFTPHSYNEIDNKINFLPIKNSKSKNNSKSKTKKNKHKNSKNNNTLKSLNNSKSKIINKNFEKDFIHKRLINELTWSQNISMNNSGIPKSMSKINKSKINNKRNDSKRSNSKQLYNEKQNNKNGLIIMNISGKENIPVNKTCLSSIRRKNTINTSNNSFYNKIF